MALEEIRAERIKKLKYLEESGQPLFPAKTIRTHLIADLLARFSPLVKSKKKVEVAGRIMAKREHGGATFADIVDSSGKIQVFFKKDILGNGYDLFTKTADIGDFIYVSGRLFKTKRDEKTVEADHWSMLVKSLMPLPEKWHGLQDVEERFRKRYLDLLMNEGVKERFHLRSKIISAIRNFFEKSGFLEVETPVFHSLAGGALARPFKTHHNALDADFYLRIAPELFLKRLLVGGLEKIYELGKVFRNEGIDSYHNPEFTELEAYAAFWDEERMMEFTEELFVKLVKSFGKNSKIIFDGKEIVFKKHFSRMTFKEVLARYGLINDYDRETRDTLATRARQFGIEISSYESKAKIADEIYKKKCRPYLVQPTFVINHPLEISPLAKIRAENPSEVRRFQLIAGGMELTNAFSELNDPLEQRRRFEEQEKEEARGEEEAHKIDEEFLEALEYGMPPAAGLGIGIDRVVMLFTDTKNIREVVLFPTLRPK